MSDPSSPVGINSEAVFRCYEVQCLITRYLGVSDLKSLRLVSKLWMEAALPSLKAKGQVCLSSYSTFSSYIDYLLDTNLSVCYSNYKVNIKTGQFQSGGEALFLFTVFWDLCSTHVRELSLSMTWTCTFPILNHIYFPSVDKPNSIPLEKFLLFVEDVGSDDNNERWLTVPESAEGMYSDGDGEEEASSSSRESPVLSANLTFVHLNVSIVLNSEKKVFPFTWTQFFTVSPNICHLSIQSDYGSGHFYKIMSVLAERKMVMKTLKIGTRDQRVFSDEFLRTLSLLTTDQTEVMSVGFLPSIRHDTPLESILAKTSASLKHLTFLQIRTSNQAMLTCFTSSDSRTFPNLQTLRITKELAPHLNFLLKMPKLRRLEIFRDSTVGQHDELSNPVIRTRDLPVMTNLQSLVLEPFIPVEEVWKLTRWFPNLTRLQMKVTDVTARIVFATWKELKELYLISQTVRDNNDLVRTTLTDEGLSGIEKEIVKEHHQLTHMENVDDTNSIIAGCRTQPYIGNLKKLEICKIQAVEDYISGITDFSVFYGFMDLPKLTSLTLVKTLVSPFAVDQLRGRGVVVTRAKN